MYYTHMLNQSQTIANESKHLNMLQHVPKQSQQTTNKSAFLPFCESLCGKALRMAAVERLYIFVFVCIYIYTQDDFGIILG